MTWIDKRDNWITSGRRLQRPREEARPAARRAKTEPLTVTEAARMLGVDRKTIRKYLALDPEDEAPIMWDHWYRLPGGHIRIYAEGIERLRVDG